MDRIRIVNILRWILLLPSIAFGWWVGRRVCDLVHPALQAHLQVDDADLSIMDGVSLYGRYNAPILGFFIAFAVYWMAPRARIGVTLALLAFGFLTAWFGDYFAAGGLAALCLSIAVRRLAGCWPKASIRAAAVATS